MAQKIPLEWTLLNYGEFQMTANGDVDGAICSINDGDFNGTVLGYLEVVAKVGSSESVDVELHNPGDTTKASVTVTATSYTRYRSSSFALDSGDTEYNAVVANLSGETIDFMTIRLILIQENASGNITETMVPFECCHWPNQFDNPGSADWLWSIGSSYSDRTPDQSMFRFMADHWDPDPSTDSNCAIYLEIVYRVADSMYDCNIKLIESNDFDDNITEVYTLVSGGVSETPVRVRSGDISSYFSNGNYYRLRFETEGTKSSRGMIIYAARFLVYSYDTGGIAKLETRRVLVSDGERQHRGKVSLPDYVECYQYWDPDEIEGYGYHSTHWSCRDCGSTYSPSDNELRDTDGPTKLPGSTTWQESPSGGTNVALIAYGTRITGQYPPNHEVFTSTITKWAMCLEGDGGKGTWKVYCGLRREGSPTGNVYAKIYALTGTVGTDAVPTGSALAISDAVDITTISNSDIVDKWGAIVEFVFSTPFAMTDGVWYFISIEYDDADGTDYLEMHWSQLFNLVNAAYYDGSWNFDSGSTGTGLWLERLDDITWPETAQNVDVYGIDTNQWIWGLWVTFYFDVALLSTDLSITESDAVESTAVTDVVVDVVIPGPTLLIDETDAVETVTVAESVPRPDVAYDAAEMITTPSYDTEPGAANYRVVVPATDIDFEGEQIRVILLGDDSVTLNITGCSIGLRESTSEDYEVAAFQKLTFGGADGVAIPAGGEVFSDWEDFPCDQTEDYLVHIYVAAAHEYPWEAD